MRKHERTAKISQRIKDNLTYYRLKADLAAVESEISENQPAYASANQNFFQKTLTDMQNEWRKATVQQLTTEKKYATEAIATFEREHKTKELKLSQTPEKLKATLNKELFKGDEYGVARMQFALTFMMEDDRIYRRPEDSLAAVSELLFNDPDYMSELYAELKANFVYIHNVTDGSAQNGFLSVVGLSSLLPFSTLIVGGAGLVAFVRNQSRQQRMKEAFRSLSGRETNVLFAIKLTLIRETKKTMPKEKWNVLIDEYLKLVNDFRADAEYMWLVEQSDAPVCKEKIAVSDLCVERLSQIVGA